MATNFNIKTILIAPLDWGLGHATRCIPIIKALQSNGYTIVVAANGSSLALLQAEFASITFIPLRGYNIYYTKNKWLLPFKMLIQIPKILGIIKYENKWLQQIITQYKIQLVISDNRYGLFSTTVPCVFITHQLTIKTSFILLEKFLQKLNYRYINKFFECWVPDEQSKNSIAGILSNPKKIPKIPVHYIGALSRFTNSFTNQPIVYNYCILLSGPEPQRSLLEQKIMQQLPYIKGKILLVRGKPTEKNNLVLGSNINVQNHLPQAALQQAIVQSEYIICRSGYTTIMELLALQKKAILIPTPGQTEQEYLAKKLHAQQWCFSMPQANFSLVQAVQNAENFNYKTPTIANNNLAKTLQTLINKIQSK